MTSDSPVSKLIWSFAEHRLSRDRIPLLMGILNVTPDSFSDGGKYNTPDAAVERGLQLVEDGADVLDVGGESTRPGAESVSCTEELRRTIPVVEHLVRQVRVPISIDTTKAEVARQALGVGATIVNDISGLTFDPKMLSVCRNSAAGVCLMHIQGTPQTMQANPQYTNVVAEVCESLERLMTRCVDAGIEPERICLDPGIGFGKAAHHNIELLSAVGTMRQRLGRPLLIGHSRKKFLSKLLGRRVEELISGTVGVSIALAGQGADILRVHDVRAVRDALIAWSAVNDGLFVRPLSSPESRSAC